MKGKTKEELGLRGVCWEGKGRGGRGRCYFVGVKRREGETVWKGGRGVYWGGREKKGNVVFLYVRGRRKEGKAV